MATILVIDDEPSIRSVLRSVLEEAGHAVLEASDGAEGIARYRCQPADVVITDLLMPKLNGLEMMMTLIREFLNVKVIAISGVVGDDNQLSSAKLLGARHIFYKPFDPRQIVKAVSYELAH